MFSDLSTDKTNAISRLPDKNEQTFLASSILDLEPTG